MGNRGAGAMLAAGMLALALLVGCGAAVAAPFRVSSSSFADGGMLARKNAADDSTRMCGGDNVSPALAWANAPAKTRSFVIFLLDPDGLGGQSVSHWVGYGIPARVTGFPEGALSKQSANFVGGKGTRNNGLYIGPCPPVGETAHHYLFTVVATDLDPGALRPRLTRDEVYAAIKGHALAGASIVGRYAR
jgi:Raf kinase inhibitor-like YbhB/YbcL family protein